MKPAFDCRSVDLAWATEEKELGTRYDQQPGREPMRTRVLSSGDGKKGTAGESDREWPEGERSKSTSRRIAEL